LRFDLATFQQQALAGMQGAYIMFQDGDGTVVGYLGPFKGGEGTAQAALASWMAAEKAAVEAVDADSPWAMWPYFFHTATVHLMTPHEIECLHDPERNPE
jgi:hypothetical protein